MGFLAAAQRSAPSRASAPGGATATSRGRLAFVDVARALAIVMMLQGHFVALTLATPFRDLTDPIYLAHARLRGLTAPLFLTVSGLVFVYFVHGGPTTEGLANPRLRRGLRRGMMLIALGYLLRFDLLNLLQPDQSALSRMAGTHVLHVVGAGLLTLSLLLAARLPRALLAGLLALLSLAFFLGNGLVHGLDLHDVPRGLSSYLVAAHGGQFSLFPWLGYVCVGGACGALLRAREDEASPLRQLAWPLTLLAIGGVLEARATPWVFRLYRACGEGPLCEALPATHNYLHKVAAVLGVLALLMLAEPLLRRHAPRWLARTGQHTLLIFVVHAVVLYGAFTGFGVAHLMRRAFTPLQAALGALVFVALHVGLVQLWVRRPFGAWRAAAPRPSKTAAAC